MFFPGLFPVRYSHHFSASGYSHPLFLLPGRSASASPAELIPGSFKFPSSATGAILSLQEGIVNVFSVFYLFQTIHTIQYFLTNMNLQNMGLPIIIFIPALYGIWTEKTVKGLPQNGQFDIIEISRSIYGYFYI